MSQFVVRVRLMSLQMAPYALFQPSVDALVALVVKVMYSLVHAVHSWLGARLQLAEMSRIRRRRSKAANLIYQIISLLPFSPLMPAAHLPDDFKRPHSLYTGDRCCHHICFKFCHQFYTNCFQSRTCRFQTNYESRSERSQKPLYVAITSYVDAHTQLHYLNKT